MVAEKALLLQLSVPTTFVGRARSSFLPMLAILMSLAMAMPSNVGGRQLQVAGQDEPPPEVLELLPPDAKLITALNVDLTLQGEPHWVLHYATYEIHPQYAHIQWTHAHLAVAALQSGRWEIVREVAIEHVMGDRATSVSLLEIDAIPGVVFEAYVGAHGSHMIILRWDGADYSAVFDKTAGCLCITAGDVDGDGTPEVKVGWPTYCPGYGGPAVMDDVYRWDGESFQEATGLYPGVLAQLERGWQGMVRIDSPSDVRACGHTGLAYLANLVGDTSRAEAECRLALEIDRAYLQLRWPFCEEFLSRQGE